VKPLGKLPLRLDKASLTRKFLRTDTELKMQLSFKKGKSKKVAKVRAVPLHLSDLHEGEEAVLDRLDLPEEMATRLMELGFIPGSTIVAARSAPSGDPRVFRVDGSEIALRRETAAHLYLRR